ncbi:MAG: peptidyl-prolyl cis-trans isomerase [Muribaculaceae bacterium]|nr:peptidyl-prolyl cis-trans isomerase [Muribaculaceae bacterium]
MTYNIIYNNRQAARGWLTVILLVMLLGSCSSDVPATPESVLVQIGSHTLTREDMAKVTPAGLSAEDSAKFVKAYATKWIDENLVNEIASGEVDIERIDNLVAEYRRELILREYTDRMYRQNASELPEDSLRSFYDSHPDLFRLAQPMLRGTYIKIDATAPNLRRIRRLYSSDKPEDADMLEKELLSDAIHYDYFRDQWVPWDQIENRIPYDFGTNPYLWPAKGRHLDFSQNGNTYLLYISDIIPVGQIAPYEAARPDIVTRMLNAERSKFQTELLRELLQKAVNDKRAVINI